MLLNLPPPPPLLLLVFRPTWFDGVWSVWPGAVNGGIGKDWSGILQRLDWVLVEEGGNLLRALR